jgi:hypothetical protein
VAEELRTCTDGNESGRAWVAVGAKRRQRCQRGRGISGYASGGGGASARVDGSKHRRARVAVGA